MNIRSMEWRQFFEEQTTELIAGVVGVVFLALNKFFKKLPDAIIQRIRSVKHIDVLKAGRETNIRMNRISYEGNAMHYLLVEYTNGGDSLKRGKDVNVQVTWEEVGHKCNDCDKDCPLHGNFESLYEDWKRPTKIMGRMYNVAENTLNSNGDVSTADVDTLDLYNQKVWRSLGIQYYKEALIKHKSRGWVVLGLTYCKGMKDQMDNDDPLMTRTARNLFEYV
jgi:hypothetical protein